MSNKMEKTGVKSLQVWVEKKEDERDAERCLQHSFFTILLSNIATLGQTHFGPLCSKSALKFKHILYMLSIIIKIN